MGLISSEVILLVKNMAEGVLVDGEELLEYEDSEMEMVNSDDKHHPQGGDGERGVYEAGIDSDASERAVGRSGE